MALAFLVFFSVMRGCMPKMETDQTTTRVTDVKVLPELNQNSMHLTNRSGPARTPDFGFQEADPDVFEEAPKGEEPEFLGD